MGNVKTVPPAVAHHDFYATNGGVHSTSFEGASMTRQEFAEECDINALMKRYEGHDIGAIMRSTQEPRYVDFTAVPYTLLDYMQLMQEAEAAFMTLPAVVRREFDNNAHMFVDFASDPENLDQMRTWGLAPPAKPAPEPAVGAAAPAAPPVPGGGDKPPPG